MENFMNKDNLLLLHDYFKIHDCPFQHFVLSNKTVIIINVFVYS